ncbi:hypothetical protein GEMRC1_005818 [Eukaryota sp. GEM-RC1]
MSRSLPSTVSCVVSNCDELSILASSTYPPFKRIHAQQTLLVLIHLHLLRRLFKRSFEYWYNQYSYYDGQTSPPLAALKTALPTFFEQVGYVSNHFLDSSFQAVKMFFQLHTFHADRKHFPELISLASFFWNRSTICFLTR